MNTTLHDWFQRGVALLNSADPIGAIGCFRRAAAINPRVAEIHYNLGMALQSVGNKEEAAACYLRAAQLKPGFAEAFNNLGNLHLDQKRYQAAQHAYEKAVEANPDLIQAHFNLGLSLKKQSLHEPALREFQTATRLAPDYHEAWDNLFDSLWTLRRGEEALALFAEYERAATPSLTMLLHGLSNCRRLDDPQREARYLDMLRGWQFTNDDAVPVSEVLGCIQYFDVEPEFILRLYQTYNRLIASRRPARIPLLPPRRTAGGKIRIGYLSPDFRHHVMGLLMLEVFERHDRERFEIYAYSLAKGRNDDEVAKRFQEISHKFVSLAAMEDSAAARQIAEDDLDLLVDLGGHTAHSRPAILASKCARTQVTHLGYHGAVGLDAVAYKITDEYADLPENADYMIEDLLPMKGCIFPFRHVEPAEPHDYGRAALGLEGKTVFGVFVNIMKLSPRCLAAWRAILERVPDGVLAFSPIGEDEKHGYLRHLGAAGIGPEKIVFIPSAQEERAGRARYFAIDIVLDTFPYSGGDTTLVALDMAIPVVVLCGKRHSERTSYSILMNLGVEDTIAQDQDGYVELACRLALDPQWRNEVREKIRRGLRDSALVDMDGYVANLEEAFVRAIRSKTPNDAAEGKLSAAELKATFQAALRAHQSGDTAEAEASYRRVLEDQPGHAPACHLYGALLAARGEREQALEWQQAAVAAAPEYEDALASLGNLQLDLGRYEDAAATLRRLLELNPHSRAGLNDLGIALTKLGRHAEAIDSLRKAAAAKPDDAACQFNLGAAHQGAHQPREAAAAYNRALAIQPDHVEAMFNLGVVFDDLGHPERAQECYRRVLKLRPGYELAHAQLGESLFAAGKIDDWLKNFREFEKEAPASFRMALQAVEAYQYLGEPDRVDHYLGGLLKNRYPANDLHELVDGLEQLFFPLLFCDIDYRQLFLLYQAYNAAMRQIFPEPVTLPAQRKPGKIRVGYLSADLRDHVMGKMMWEVLQRHDRSRFEIYCYSLNPREDAFTANFRGVSQKFVSLAGVDEHAAARAIAQDELDILVDLCTHTKGARPGILALKPARVQITHIASAGAVGLETIDFKLTDHYADTPAAQEHLIETLLPMAGCVYPYRRIEPAPNQFQRRDISGVRKDAVIIGAFFTLMKLGKRCLSVWREVLERIPNAVLAFSPLAQEARPSYLRRLKAAGIDANRIVFIPASKDETVNQARYNLVDLVLDPFPYNGVNGTLEALTMGIPVVAMVGGHHSERTSYSMLANLGVTDTVAHSFEEYVDIAARLATDKTFHAQVVDAIRKGMADSLLVDMDRHVANLEDAYMEALKRKGVAPAAQ
jgi:predicted O-linked N-acetylglucosamine transferase (SPINDLY family)